MGAERRRLPADRHCHRRDCLHGAGRLLRAANTTLDTSLLRLVVLLYCLRLHASSRTQTLGLLGSVSSSKRLKAQKKAVACHGFFAFGHTATTSMSQLRGSKQEPPRGEAAVPLGGKPQSGSGGIQYTLPPLNMACCLRCRSVDFAIKLMAAWAWAWVIASPSASAASVPGRPGSCSRRLTIS